VQGPLVATLAPSSSVASRVPVAPIAPIANDDPASARVAIRKAARAAFDAKDWPAYRARIGELERVFHGHPDVVLMLASAEARLGNTDAAIAELGVYADMGLTYDAVADPDLASIASAPAFAAVVERLAHNARAITTAARERVVEGAGGDFVAEDVAYDSAHGTWFVSSVRKGTIVALSGAHRGKHPIESVRGQSIMGLAFDDQRHVLFATLVTTSAIGFPDAPSDVPPKTALVELGLDGRPAAVHSGGEGKQNALTDLALAADGTLYASNSISGDVYALARHAHDANGATLAKIAPPDTFVSPQTVAPLPDGTILVPDYARGIARLDPKTSRVTWLSHPRGIATSGIDGLYWSPAARALVAVQNGTKPARIVRFAVDAAFTRIESFEVLEQGPALGAPTHGVLVAPAGGNARTDFVFIADSGWDRFDDDLALKKGATFEPPRLMRVSLAVK
jgi:hypothetical protein